MKTLRILGGAAALLIVAGGITFAVLAARLEPDVVLGSESPDVVLTTLDDEPLPLASLRGDVVLLDFWSST